jgi:hypothetical protein
MSPPFRINRNANIDSFEEPPLARFSIIPRIERGLGRASGGNGAHEPDRHIFAFRPVCNIGLVGYARPDHACMRSRHSQGHRASQSPQWLGRARLGEAFGGALDVRSRDRSPGPGRLRQVKVNVELARKCPHGRKGLKALQRCRLGWQPGSSEAALLALQFPDHRASIRFGPLGKFDERSAHFYEVPLGAKKAHDAAALGGRHLDDCLVSFD